MPFASNEDKPGQYRRDAPHFPWATSLKVKHPAFTRINTEHYRGGSPSFAPLPQQPQDSSRKGVFVGAIPTRGSRFPLTPRGQFQKGGLAQKQSDRPTPGRRGRDTFIPHHFPNHKGTSCGRSSRVRVPGCEPGDPGANPGGHPITTKPKKARDAEVVEAAGRNPALTQCKSGRALHFHKSPLPGTPPAEHPVLTREVDGANPSGAASSGHHSPPILCHEHPAQRSPSAET